MARSDSLIASGSTVSYPSGTRFRFYLQTENEGYVYAFASDLTGKINQIFPYDRQVSPLVGAQSTVAFPGDTKVIRMDQQPGTDYLLILFSQQALDDGEILRRMQAASGSLSTRLATALGDALIDPADVDYRAGQPGFSVRPGARGTVAPLLVELSHQ